MFSISLMNKMPRMSCLFKSFKGKNTCRGGKKWGGEVERKKGSIRDVAAENRLTDYLPRNTVYVYMNFFD